MGDMLYYVGAHPSLLNNPLIFAGLQLLPLEGARARDPQENSQKIPHARARERAVWHARASTPER